jgi:hypothetical protein
MLLNGNVKHDGNRGKIRNTNLSMSVNTAVNIYSKHGQLKIFINRSFCCVGPDDD